MAKSSGLNFNLPSVDDLFSTEEERAEARLEKVVNLSPAEISDFPNHPFKVRMDEAMQEMTESVKQYGVLVPTLVRPKPEGGYEMVAGHRRKKAADLAGLAEIPCIVRQLTDDEATIIMVDSNLQREQILPSEKAFAYKMKLDAIKRQAGRPSKENGATVLPHFSGKKSREILAEQSGESHEQIRKYIRLTHLIPEILELVDNSVLKDQEMLQIAMRPAVELSYLRKEEQADLFAIMDEMDCTPSHAQAIKMRQMSEAKTGDERLAKEPWTESYFSRCAIVGMSPKSLTATTSRSGSFAIARNTSRPMRPNPLMPTFVAMRISFRQDTHSPSKRHRDHTTSALLRRAFGPLSREKADERRAPAPQRGHAGTRHGASASAQTALRGTAAWSASVPARTELRGSAA